MPRMPTPGSQRSAAHDEVDESMLRYEARRSARVAEAQLAPTDDRGMLALQYVTALIAAAAAILLALVR
jgi:hypothetical protein